jgi:2-dehydro-3-deoxygalactonokinase
LSNTLFRVRAGVVAKAAPAQQAAAVVSGLLIGAEFTAAAHAVAGGGGITVIGSPALAQRYAQAASHFGCLARCSIRTGVPRRSPAVFPVIF